MDTPKAQKHPNQYFDWDVFMSHLLGAYLDIDSPNYLFTHVFFDEQKYLEVLQFIEAHYKVTEDTEPNTDVSYGYFVECGNWSAILRVSFVGRYFYLSSLFEGGGEEEPTVETLSDSSKSSLMRYMLDAGFVFTSGNVLKKKIMFGGQPTSVYSLLYSYEGEPSWL